MKTHNINLINGEKSILFDNDQIKILKSDNYNFIFNKKDGFFARWGKTKNDDGDPMLGLPEIADIEIAEICVGVPGIGPCSFCYKNNTGNKGQNMTLDTFKTIFHKLPPTVGQIAFGCGTLRKHPEMWDIFKYTKDNGVIPNLTINGDVDEHELDKIADLCGACAVSIYDKDISYNAIKELTGRGMKQVNIHYMISEETFDKAFEIMNDIKKDTRLSKLNAIVFLSLKPKGRSYGRFKQLSVKKFKKLVEYAFENKVPIGFDSCSTKKFMKSIEDNPNKKNIETFVEPCESTLYSMYINVNGDFYPCSFADGVSGWEKGMSVIDCNNFLEEIWFNDRVLEFRKKLLQCNRNCPLYEI